VASTPATRPDRSGAARLTAVWLASTLVLAACLLAGFRMDFAGDVAALLRANAARVLLAAGAGAALALSGALRL